jgi:energy-coupling factor transporter ATP-binding protein EcfA2
MNALEVRGLTFTYAGSHRPAVSEVELSLDEGKLMLLAGPSGCGKTTLLRAISGLIPRIYPGEYRGEVLIGGRRVLEMSHAEIARSVGYVFQNPENQLVSYTVESDVYFGLENLGYDRETMRRKVDETLAELGIEELRRMPIRNLSDGQKQLVAIAGMLVMEPKLLILDEPTSTLDPLSARRVAWMLRSIVDKRGISAIVVEHRLEVFLELSDYMGIMSDGRLIRFGEVREVLESPESQILRLPAHVEVQMGLWGSVRYARFSEFLRALEERVR